MRQQIYDRNLKQEYKASCALKCQQLVLLDYGINVSEQELYNIALQNGWCDVYGGVHMRDNGKLLGCFGVEYCHSQGNTLSILSDEIKSRHRVIVNVNHAKLAGLDDKYNQAAHAIMVTSINEDCVFIINPAKGIMDEEISLTNFLKSWMDSDYYMLSTINRALYSYDSSTQSMIKF